MSELVATDRIEITDDEAALYDRQIRLWGVNAQKKLRTTDILIAGMNGVGSEIIKNIVLSGVNSITLMDDQNVSIYDTTCNLFTRRQIGQNRAQVSVKYVKSLNPMVDVKFDASSIGDQPKQFFSQFQVICLAGFDRNTTTKVNRICNELNIKFYATCSWGLFAFGFSDQGLSHTYYEEEMQSGDVTIGDYEPIKKKAKVELDSMKNIVEKKLSFVNFDTALAVKAGKSGYGLTKRTNSTFIISHIMLEFHAQHSRYPMPSSRQSDVSELKRIQTEVLERLGFDEEILKTNKEWHNLIFGELSPICAIVGGVIAQDIIRVVSLQGTPIRNFFLFDGLHCNGIIESVGK